MFGGSRVGLGRGGARGRGGLRAALVATTAAVLVSAPAASAAPGDLDLSFGSGGKVITDFGGTYGGAWAVAIQSDGKIVVAGDTGNAYETRSIAVARYNADGSRDESFAGDGMQTTDVGGGFGSGARGLALQPDGRIVVAGVGGGVSTEQAVVVRYSADGSLDSSFSTDGKMTIDFGGTYGEAQAVAIQPDGKILIGGGNPSYPDAWYGIARLSTSGELDSTFSGDGKQTVSITGAWESVQALALDGVGRIVAGGRTDSDWGLFRLDSNGALDTSFSDDGKQITDFGGTYEDGSDNLADIAIQPDGRIIGVGVRWSFPEASLLARYHPNGTLDQSFGQDGLQAIAGSEMPSNALALQANGKIVAVGANGLVGFVVARHNPDGSLDDGFMGDGLGTIPFAGYGAHDVAIQDDGSIVVVGGDKDEGFGSDAEFGLIRLEGGEIPLDTSPPGSTITFGPSGVVSDQTPTFGFSSSETGSTFECQVDSGMFSACTSPHTTSTLGVGAHTFYVRATDQAGNTDPTPATRSFTVQVPSPPSGGGPKPPPGGGEPEPQPKPKPTVTAACKSAQASRTKAQKSAKKAQRKLNAASGKKAKAKARKALKKRKAALGKAKKKTKKACA